MPPSGEELILKLLSQSVARLESGDRKRKQEEKEVTFLDDVKRVRKDVPATPSNNDIIASLIVYHHLKEVSPELAVEFSALHTSKFVFNHLTNASPELTEELAVLQQSCMKPYKKKMVNKKAGVSSRRFTPKEDDIINEAIKEAGKDTIVNVKDLAKKLNRPEKSVIDRIGSLKRNGGLHKVMRFTLIEDTMILEQLVIPRVRNEKLSEIVLHKHQGAELTKQLNKSRHGVLKRWGTVIQPWLLQHYSGTLNLRVERMVPIYILDTDFTIEWSEVAVRSGFAGLTENSPRMI